jgi:hypothetical protein
MGEPSYSDMLLERSSSMRQSVFGANSIRGYSVWAYDAIRSLAFCPRRDYYEIIEEAD